MLVLWIALGAVLVTALIAWYARTHPSACPYAARFFVQPPHPLITRKRLREVLDPDRGERILEVGPGTGYYTLELAEWVGAEGSVEIFDLQQKFLDHTIARARQRGLKNVRPKQGNAESLPYEDDSFDAAVLTTVLGEIPDEAAALREHHRVLRPGGRLVVGELAIADPHFVGFDSLVERAEAAGFRTDRRSGGRLGYFARFTK